MAIKNAMTIWHIDEEPMRNDEGDGKEFVARRKEVIVQRWLFWAEKRKPWRSQFIFHLEVHSFANNLQTYDLFERWSEKRCVAHRKRAIDMSWLSLAKS